MEDRLNIFVWREGTWIEVGEMDKNQSIHDLFSLLLSTTPNGQKSINVRITDQNISTNQKISILYWKGKQKHFV